MSNPDSTTPRTRASAAALKHVIAYRNAEIDQLKKRINDILSVCEAWMDVDAALDADCDTSMDKYAAALLATKYCINFYKEKTNV